MLHDVECEELHRDCAQACGSEDQVRERPGQASPVLKYPLSKASSRRTFRSIRTANIFAIDTFAVWNAWVISTAMYTYTTVYYIHHYPQLLMIIYIQIINLFYSYVLFYAIAIKISSEHDLFCYACLWQKLSHGKKMTLPKLIIGHRVGPEMLVEFIPCFILQSSNA